MSEGSSGNRPCRDVFCMCRRAWHSNAMQKYTSPCEWRHANLRHGWRWALIAVILCNPRRCKFSFDWIYRQVGEGGNIVAQANEQKPAAADKLGVKLVVENLPGSVFPPGGTITDHKEERVEFIHHTVVRCCCLPHVKCMKKCSIGLQEILQRRRYSRRTNVEWWTAWRWWKTERSVRA